MNTGAPSLEDLVEWSTSPSLLYTATYASGWVVRETVAPAWAQTPLAVVLAAAPFVGVVLLARATGVSLARSRCRARKNDGERCTRDADGYTSDLCWQHARLSDVELVDVDEDGGQ